MQLQDFHNLHRGQTCLIAGVGPNLNLTPPERFAIPSFGVNTVYKYEGWTPTYYVGVDERLKVENGAAVVERYKAIPKFFPAPDWDDLPGENIYRFKHRQGSQYIHAGQSPTHRDALTVRGITYFRIMDAVFQIAAWMGFTTMLMIGVQHKPGTRNQLFWGEDTGEPEKVFVFEEEGYRFFASALPVKIINISADTYVSEDVLPRDDWRKWVNQ
jgi:hypothetical protein